MNQWPADQQQYSMMPQMMGMGMPNPMMPNMMPPIPPGGQTMGNVPNDWGQMMNAANTSGNFIGPIVPEPTNEGKQSGGNKNENRNGPGGNKNGGDSRRDKDRRGRSPDRRDRDRGDRSRSDRRGERRSKWSDNQSNNMPNNNMMMANMQQGNMVPYQNNMMEMPMHGTNMGAMTMMPNGMPMMSNMIDQNQLMMAQAQMQMQMGHQSQPVGQQPFYVSNGILLPPIPGVTTPARREKPSGCRTIFIGGLPSVTDEVVAEIFQRFGDIKDVKLHKQGVCHVRFEKPEFVEQSFFLTGYRYKLHDQMENEATTLFIDYALNREDQEEFEKNRRKRETTPVRVEPFTPANLTTVTEKIKSDTDFAEVAPTLASWLEHGECNKKNANTFYSLVQTSNSQIRRLYNEKMQVDEEYQNLKTSLRDKFASVITQFEQVAKILSAAKHQRVSDHFSKQQRRNIEMWLKMTEDLENMREEFNTMFDDDEAEVTDTRNMVPLRKYEELKTENENLVFELEGYRNEAHLAKDEAERKFEKFKAQYIAQQALHHNPSHGQLFPPLPPPPLPPLPQERTKSHQQELKASISQTEAKLISVLTAYLLAQPLGSTLENLVYYVKSIIPAASQAAVFNVLRKYGDLFKEQGTEGRWMFVTFDIIKKEKF